jgi:hypothetical protein
MHPPWARMSSIIILTVGLSAELSARVWYVTADGSGDAPTIQAAIDGAIAGDEILVAAGVYRWSTQGGDSMALNGPTMLTMRSGIAVRSQSGPYVTIIDAESKGRVVRFEATTGVLLEGFSIRGGNAAYPGGPPGAYSKGAGGAILCRYSSSVGIVGKHCARKPLLVWRRWWRNPRLPRHGTRQRSLSERFRVGHRRNLCERCGSRRSDRREHDHREHRRRCVLLRHDSDDLTESPLGQCPQPSAPWLWRAVLQLERHRSHATTRGETPMATTCVAPARETSPLTRWCAETAPTIGCSGTLPAYRRTTAAGSSWERAAAAVPPQMRMRCDCRASECGSPHHRTHSTRGRGSRTCSTPPSSGCN